MNDKEPIRLFADLAEKQKKLKANMKPTTLEQARAIIKWLKELRQAPVDKRQR